LSKAYSSLDTAGGGATVTEEEERLNQQSYMKDSD
jgi:ribosomal protein S25